MSEATTAGRSARQVLAWSRSVVDPALRAAVDALPVSMRRVTGYHLGWWDEHGRESAADGGTALRPALVLLAAQATGGTPAAALPAAVAADAFHASRAATRARVLVRRRRAQVQHRRWVR
jgi:geranylgeranyl diphosphate synthase type I